MKLRELNENSRNEYIVARAKKNFIQDLVTNLQKVLAKPNITQVTTPPETTEPNVAQQPKPAVWRSGRNPNGPAFARENVHFDRLNALFESIINIDEETPAQTRSPLSIADLITTNFISLMNAPYAFSPNNTETLPIIQKFAKEIENTYAVDGGKKAMEELGEWAWDTLTEIKQQSNVSKRGATTNTAAPQQSTTTPQQSTSQPKAPAEVQQSKVGVRQINKLIPTLRKRDLLSVKKNVDNTLAGKSSIEPAKPTNTGANTFGKMASQLSGSNKSKSSTGGTITKTPTGIVHTSKPQQEPAQEKPKKDNIISLPKNKVGKVRAAREGGVTPEEQAKFDEKVRQAMANQKS